MCNSLRNGNRVYPIPEWGFGYKAFNLPYNDSKNGKNIGSLYKTTRMPRNEWVIWNTEKYREGGFCFFSSTKDIKRFIKLKSPWLRVYRIRYRKGLGKRREEFFHPHYYISSLCKEFKILKEVDIKDLK